jgi:hypothetical protein
MTTRPWSLWFTYWSVCFDKDHETAERIMLEIHNEGVGIWVIYSYDAAHAKITEILDLAHKHRHPLAASMKSCATRVRVRFFKVTTPLGTLFIGSSTGNTFSSGAFNRKLQYGSRKIVRKRPVAKRLMRTSVESAMTVVRG